MVERVAPNIEAKIQGEVSGQVIVGNHNVQVLAEHGALVNVIASEHIPQPRPRPTPVLALRPRRFQGLLDRNEEIKAVISGLPNGPVEIYGEPGIGKTSVLRHLAYHPEVKRFRAGAIYRLAHREPAADLLQFIFDAFYETDVPLKPTDTQVRHLLREKEGLILLDDTEQPREEIEGLTDAVPTCAFVFASAERRIWGAGQSVGVRGLPTEDAVALVEREIGRPLAPEEVEAARTLCESVQGNPLRIQQEVAAARDERRSLLTIAAQRSKAAQQPGEQIEQSLSALPDSARSVLATLAAFGGASVHGEHLDALCGLPDLPSVLQKLQQRNLIQLDDSRYRLTGSLAGVLERAWDLTTERERAAVYFAGWAERHRQSHDDLLKEANCIQELLGWAGSTGRWREVQRLGRAIEGALTVSGRWEAWKSVVQLVLRASLALGDRAGEGWALHQLGTRALCLSDPATAKAQLGQALKIRELIDDRTGAAVTRHNLNIIPTITPGNGDSDSPSGGVPPTKIPLLLKVGVSALLISMAGLGIRLMLAGSLIPHPSALTATATPSHVSLSWVDNSDTETEFRIERRKDNGPFIQIGVSGASNTTFIDPNPDANTSYVYRVRAANADGESEYSNEPTVLTFPAVPADLSVQDVPPDVVALKWSDRSPNPSRFKIERSTDAGATFNEVATTPAGQSTYSDAGGPIAATRYYRVRATNPTGDSNYSKTVTWSASPKPPDVPQLLEVTAVSSTQTILRWTDTDSNEAGYKIERKLGAGPYGQVAFAEPNTTTYEDREVTGEATYSYRIRATNAAGDSAYSNEVRVTTPPELPPAPTGLGAKIDREGTVRISWTDNSNNEIGFRIERRSNRDSSARIITVAVNSERFSDSDLLPDTRYSYRVQAFNRAGSSAFSNEAIVTTASRRTVVRLISLDLGSGSIVGGKRVRGRIALSGAAPEDGATVTLTTESEAVRIPANVTINSGDASADFTIGTGRVRTNTKVAIYASFAGETKKASLELLPEEPAPAPDVRLESLDVSRERVTGGESMDGSVKISGRAPIGGVVITLTGSRAVTLPPNVTISAGSKSASFRINTNPVRRITRAEIIATLGGENKSVSLQLLPEKSEPQQEVSLVSLDLNPGRVRGGTSVEGKVTLSGVATQTLLVNLTSSNPRIASVPAMIRVLIGSSGATFKVQTFGRAVVLSPTEIQTRRPWQRAAVVEITAQLAGTTLTAKLEVW